VITCSASRINERKSARGAFAYLLILALASFSAGRGIAEGAAPAEQEAQLQARLDRIRVRDDAKYASYAIERAERAMETASAAKEPSAVSRAHEIARAAMVLAERQLERRQVQAELLQTQRRLTATREKANAQRRVLEALMRERASLARAGEKP
jgi:hypothetical protein